ncbi:MAG TPA: hypothetical protein VF618_08555 [Thermoanaerobaculia bacterium]
MLNRKVFLAIAISLLAVACQREEPLTEAKARAIIEPYLQRREPTYAEVPQRVWWGPSSPKDAYDGLAVQTLRKLEQAGLVTVTESTRADGGMEYIAKVTQKGFPILGTAPSMRGPVYRGLICYKVYDNLRSFQQHPAQKTVGAAEIVWHYDEPTNLYPLFDTKINKPLKKPFFSHVSFWYEEHQWKFNVNVKKAEG